jgi:hypothetical protein
MPRGKRQVYGLYCKEDNSRIGSVRFHRQNSKGVAWKDNKLEKYCPACRKKVEGKLKEEKHSS